jgi:hypothetical protein
MIPVNLFKVKGITAMFCSLTQCKPPFSLREFYIGSEGIRIGSARVAQEAFRQARAGTGRGRKQSSTRMPFNLESKRHEQKSRGFAGL